ncbi:unnamed protein product [Fraxinus pennsylvanica]|uniref:Malectin-like domain-containing protein n=1 Tax=Fraxinus pennsylvanica TaxID=56036 RepID=A0AAD2DUT9_9LAMI|nr:unnamed protein product [Fraxinus pennsylvanica]
MDIKCLHFLSLYLNLTLSLFFISRAAFTPQDNYLVNCGSSTSNIAIDNRIFYGDSSKNGTNYLSKGKSTSLTNPNPTSNYSVLYTTARVFTSASSYVFHIKKTGTHFVRLHFSPFSSQNYDLKNANFGVSANGFTLLGDFVTKFTIIKEFILMVDKLELEILFMPVNDSSFAFVNGIEVLSASKDFLIDAGEIALISPSGTREFKQNISLQILETVHRINVGGSKITPFNDTLWRSWVPDEDFLVLKSAAKFARTSDPPNYQRGGATREIAPDNVYMTAQQMNVENGTLNFMFNVTWDFPVRSSVDDMHFVRLHFCDIVSVSLNTLYFNVYINGITAYKDLDLSSLAFHLLASPYYIDFVVKSADNSNFIRISIGPSQMSNSLRKNAILNGVEIMKIVSSAPPPRKSKKNSFWILVGSVVGGIFALSLAILAVLAMLKCKKRKPIPKPRHMESAGWTPLRVYGVSTHGTLSEATAFSPSANGYYALKIPFTDIQLATNNFDKDLIIGSGGFGTVYKGVFRDNAKIQVNERPQELHEETIVASDDLTMHRVIPGAPSSSTKIKNHTAEETVSTIIKTLPGKLVEDFYT